MADNTTRRVGSDETVSTPSAPTTDLIVADVPGGNPDKFVTITLSNPLNAADRAYLGLPADAATEVGTKVRLSINGAKAVINAGYATVDPESTEEVRAALGLGSNVPLIDGEPTGTPALDQQQNPAAGANSEDKKAK